MRQHIYEEAELTPPEIAAVEHSLCNDPTDSQTEVTAFMKLQLHFCEEIPYAIVTQSSWHPENTMSPDDWIVERLNRAG
jgi:hypothetical protein